LKEKYNEFYLEQLKEDQDFQVNFRINSCGTYVDDEDEEAAV